MKNPFGDQPLPGSYHNLTERIHKKASAAVGEQVFEMMLKACESALDEENVILSRLERKRLFSEVVKRMMADMSRRLEHS
ncbi:MAG: hypothetical protein ACOYYF_12605 [Chloroflexota bacterium]|nr:hypothetical protein [Chloroflexota bacterium]MBI5702196.1 hypothetical protein [Chloroflexota bacterium]